MYSICGYFVKCGDLTLLSYLRKLHHKLMVIDEQRIIAGSFNYTEPANKFNEENIVVIGDLDSENQVSVQQQKKLAKYALDEIERFIGVYGEPVG
jgi:phosphatidylserine/phosphatidylglycerophosphate/cardiolipin synthase-like enzyme